jgi:hypothetical protein
MIHWAGHLLWILFGPSTWGAGGNMAAWAICGLITVAAGYLLRHKIGRGLVRWLHKHHTEHMAELAAKEDK